MIDSETIQTLLDLLNPMHGEIDRQTYDERYKQGFDAPDDAEYNVDITARMERDLTQAVLILEARKRDTVTDPAAHSLIDALQDENKQLRARLAQAAVKAMEEPSHIVNIRLYEAVTLALKRLDELNRDDEAGIRLILANAILPQIAADGGEK